MKEGVNINAHKGGIQSQNMSPVGEPATNYSFRPYQPTHCDGMTRKGTACQARPVKGEILCVGHLKQAEKVSG